MKKYAVIVAGGSGQRMGTEIPKQFLQLNGKSILEITITAFTKAFEDIEVIIVLHKDYIEKGKAIAVNSSPHHTFNIVEGGETRFHSVKNGLSFVKESSIVFVHDAVRCLLSEDLIKRCYQSALQNGNAIPTIAPSDSIRLQDESGNHIMDRDKVRMVQTPQTFQSKILLKAFEQEYSSSFTDEASVAEKAGSEIFLIEGEYNNLKITRPIDLIIAEKLMESTIASIA